MNGKWESLSPVLSLYFVDSSLRCKQVTGNPSFPVQKNLPDIIKMSTLYSGNSLPKKNSGFCKDCNKSFGNIYNHIKISGHIRLMEYESSSKSSTESISQSAAKVSTRGKINMHEVPESLRLKYFSRVRLDDYMRSGSIWETVDEGTDEPNNRLQVDINYHQVAKLYHRIGEGLEGVPPRLKDDSAQIEVAREIRSIQKCIDLNTKNILDSRCEKIRLQSEMDQIENLKTFQKLEVDTLKSEQTKSLHSFREGQSKALEVFKSEQTRTLNDLLSKHSVDLIKLEPVLTLSKELTSKISNLEEQMKILELKLKQATNVMTRLPVTDLSEDDYVHERSRLEEYVHKYLCLSRRMSQRPAAEKAITTLTEAVKELDDIRFKEIDVEWFEVYYRVHRSVVETIFTELDNTIRAQDFNVWYNRYFK